MSETRTNFPPPSTKLQVTRCCRRMESNGTASIVPCHCPTRRRMQTATKSLITANFSTLSLRPLPRHGRVFRGYIEKLGGRRPRCDLSSHHNIGFACEKQGRPAEMLRIYLETSTSTGTTPEAWAWMTCSRSTEIRTLRQALRQDPYCTRERHGEFGPRRRLLTKTLKRKRGD